MSEQLQKFIVTAHRMPRNYNDPLSFIVEAEDEEAAKLIVQIELRDLAQSISSASPQARAANYSYRVRKYDLPEVRGKIVGKEGS